VEFLERLGNSQLLRTLGFSVLDRIGQGKACSGLQPMHMKIDFITWRCSFRNGFQILLGEFECASGPCIDVVTLLEVDLLKEVAAHLSGRN
jgi:hypothetical protein